MQLVSEFSLKRKKERHLAAPLPRKTSYTAQVALQHCPILCMSKRKIILQQVDTYVNIGCVRDGAAISPLGCGYYAVTVRLMLRASVALRPKYTIILVKYFLRKIPFWIYYCST